MGAYVALFVLVALLSSVEMIEVNVTQGTLECEYLTTIVGNKTYYSCKGIPYAAPPVGKLRFMSPEPPAKWTGVRNATSYGSTCPQRDVITQEIKPGSEDCLFLNVHSPNLAPETLQAVIVYIHEGSFESGAGSDYEPDFLIVHDIVLVTINYRLSALGFLSLRTEEVPGNAGLKDQVAALKWVKENIEYFGGDPDNVTIMGTSAGGASVTFHLLSPMSRGLFKRGIAMSSTALCDYLTDFKPEEKAYVLAKQAGIYNTNTTELLEALQNVSVDKLYDTNCTLMLSELEYDTVISVYDFPPVIEKHHNNNTFISKDILEILKNGSINEADVMVGYASQETAIIISLINSTYRDLYARYAEMVVPSKIYFKNTPSQNLEIGKMILKHYFPDEVSDMNSIDKLITYTSESGFVRDIIRFMNKLPATLNNTRYVYEFSMTSGMNYYGHLANAFGYSGYVAHLDDTLYLFPTALLNTTLLEGNCTELALINQYCTLVANFAKYGNPTPSDCNSVSTTWPQYDITNQRYLEIGNTQTVKTAPRAEMMAFWESLFETAGLEF